VVWSRLLQPSVKVENSPVVFVGYGVVAPEYGWDDFKGVDVRGKTLLMLINDPPVPDPNDPTKLDEKMFKGREMTYYGRWTYKYEIARPRAPPPRSSFIRPAGGISVGCGDDEQWTREFRDRSGQQSAGAREGGRVDHARQREENVDRRRGGFDQLKASRCSAISSRWR